MSRITVCSCTRQAQHGFWVWPGYLQGRPESARHTHPLCSFVGLLDLDCCPLNVLSPGCKGLYRPLSAGAGFSHWDTNKHATSEAVQVRLLPSTPASAKTALSGMSRKCRETVSSKWRRSLTENPNDLPAMAGMPHTLSCRYQSRHSKIRAGSALKCCLWSSLDNG